MTVKEFINKLDALLESGNYRTSVCDDDGRTYLSGDEVTEMDYTASGLFIMSGGTPHYDRMRELKELSNGKYYIFPGETDSFGWLTGGIRTPKGIIVYG